MTKLTDPFLEKLRTNYFENLIPKIFGENHIKIKNFDDLKYAVKTGKVSFKVKYNPKLAKENLSEQNSGFYTGIRNIKNIGTIIYLFYILISFRDYKFLFVIPILLFINHIIQYFWHTKLLTFLILIISTFFLCNYLSLNLHYDIILISYIILESITYSAYSTFFEESLSQDEITFDSAIEYKIILKVYDNYAKKTIEFDK